jgi:hypothetical protein
MLGRRYGVQKRYPVLKRELHIIIEEYGKINIT